MEHLADEEAWALAEMTQATTVPYYEQLKREAQLYFTPTFLPGTIYFCATWSFLMNHLLYSY